MADKPIGEIVGRHDSASPSAAPTTGATTATGDSAAPAKQAAETAPAGGTATPEAPEDPVAGLKGALDKERDRASRFEKDWKKSERERKQEVAVLKRQLEALQASVPKPDPKVQDEAFWQDPREYQTKQFAELKSQLAQEREAERIADLREDARDRWEDFDEVEAAFFEAAEKDPSLWNGVRGHRRAPVEAYKKMKKLMSAEETSPMSEIQQLKAEIAALKAGRDGGQTGAAAETAAAPVQKPSVPKSTAGVRGSGVGSSSSWAGPTPISKVFGRQRSAAR